MIMDDGRQVAYKMNNQNKNIKCKYNMKINPALYYRPTHRNGFLTGNSFVLKEG